MSKMLNAFLIGGAVGYSLGSRGREKTLEQVRNAAEGAWGFTLDRIHEVREAKEAPAWTDSPDSDLVDQMSDDSFPSSDPPSTYAGWDHEHVARP